VTDERKRRDRAEAQPARARIRARRSWIGNGPAWDTNTTGLSLVPHGDRRPAALDAGLPPRASGRARGAPCWLSLAARDAGAAKEFYGRVLGWCHVPLLGTAGKPRSLALKAGVPVGAISEASCELGVYAGWMPHFAVDDVDGATGRLRDRNATVAVGPLATAAGRVAVAAGPDDIVFGLRQQAPDNRWTVGDGPVARLELHTGDIFAAALFYGGVLGWAGGSEDSCDVEYVHGQIVVRDGRRAVAALRDTAVPGFEGRRGWHTCFRVTDVDRAADAADTWGGRVISPPQGPRTRRREAVLADREGIPFAVVSE
jgi:predicted enzyme related to lactoylglutathione lyase